MSVFDELRNYCPSGIIFRIDLDRVTGGMINHNTMAFLESIGRGIGKYQIIGKKAVYRIDDVISWLEKNSELEGF